MASYPSQSSFSLRYTMQRLLSQQLELGTIDDDCCDIRNDGAISLPYSARSAHMHVIGRTRSGKSRFMADLIRQDIANGHGLCLIDPHGELCELTLNWLAQNKAMERLRPNIHPVRFTDPTCAFRYNPLRIDREEDAYAVASNVTNAITRIYGGKDSTETPLLWFVLDVTCTILALRELPLAAARYFLFNSSFDQELRDKISEGVPNPYYKALGLEMSRMGPKEFRETVASTGRRLHQFLKNPLIERIFSVTDNTANLRKMMDDRHVLLLDTSDQGGLVDVDQLRAIGMLMTNNIFGVARKRDPKMAPMPFFLYIDEAQNYLSPDIEAILSQAAKRGLYVTLAHQFLGQLLSADKLIYDGVMAGTLLKAVFNVTMEDAEILVDEMFADRIEFDKVKESLKVPHVVGHTIIKLAGTSRGASTGRAESESTTQAEGRSEATSETYAYAEARSETWSDSESESDSTAESIGMFSGESESAYVPDNPALESLGMTLGMNAGESSLVATGHSSTFATSHSLTESSSNVHGTGLSKGRSWATSIGKSAGTSVQESTGESQAEALQPIFREFSTQIYSLEEQRYALKRALAYQPPRHGYFTARRMGTIGFTARDVPDPLNIPAAEAALLLRLIEKSPWITRSEEIQGVLAHPRLQAILNLSTPLLGGAPDNFMEPMDE